LEKHSGTSATLPQMDQAAEKRLPAYAVWEIHPVMKLK
jgi:hypothetical protein